MPGTAPSPEGIITQIRNAARIARSAKINYKSYSDYSRKIHLALRSTHEAQHNALFRRDIVEEDDSNFDLLTSLYRKALDQERIILKDWLKETQLTNRRWRQFLLQRRIKHLSKKIV